LSAKSESALDAATANLASALAADAGSAEPPGAGSAELSAAGCADRSSAGCADQSSAGSADRSGAGAAGLADAAYTLQVGRRVFPVARALVCCDAAEAAGALGARDPLRLWSARRPAARRPVVFLFPGQGAQHLDMALGIYRSEPVFRGALDACAELLAPHLGSDLREALYGPGGAAAGGWARRAEAERAAAARALAETRLAQPALFAVEYALAQLWTSWGITPWAMLGHSLGELTAACHAGVFSLGDALALVAARGELMQAQPGGAMLGVEMPADELAPLLPPGVEIAAVNAPAACAASGPEEAVAELAARLGRMEVEYRRLHVSHAYHSAAMEPAAAGLAERVARLRPGPPRLPYLSNLSGGWIGAAEAAAPAYWAAHARRPVRFWAGVELLLAAEEEPIFLEVGPGRTLAGLVRRHVRTPTAIETMRHPQDPDDDARVLAGAVGRLWLAGVDVDWVGYHAGERRRRVPLPTYPFERRRYWVEPGRRPAEAPSAAAAAPAPAGFSPAATAAAPAPGEGPPPVPAPAAGAPRNAAEARLVELFRRLLGSAEVGIYDNFFALGGHSLLGTRLISLIGAELGAELSIRDLFEAPTPAELAARLPSADAIPGPHARIPRAARDAEIPASFAQQRLWFLDQLSPGGSLYNLPMAIALRGELSVPALAASLAALARRHETLRTALRQSPSAAAGTTAGAVQVIAPAPGLPVPIVDLGGARHPAAAAARGEAERIIAGFSRRPFDLARAPLLRAALVRLDPAEHLLLLNLHHVIGDGWSIGILVRELGILYAQAAARLSRSPQQPPPLPELPIQYADFAAWQRRRLSGAVLARELEFWRSRLAGTPPLDLPADRARPAAASGHGAARAFTVPAPLRQEVERLCRDQGVTLFMVLLAGYGALLSRLTGQADFAVGTPIAGRTHAQTEGLIGLFVNTLVLRCGFAGDPTGAELLARVREVTLDAYAHQELPFEKLIGELQPERDLSRTPLFQVMLSLQNAPFAPPAILGLAMTLLPVEVRTARYDLTLALREPASGPGSEPGSGAELQGQWIYRTDLFDAARVERLGGQLRTLLGALTAGAGRRLSELPLLAAGERHQVLVEWNVSTEHGGDEPIHRPFERWAARAPQAVAIVASERCGPNGGKRQHMLTYGQLDAWATRLAARLQSLGAAPERAVGICAEPSFALVAGLLAILKAGAAYLPLDPSHPPERLARLLADSRAPIVLAGAGCEEKLPASPAVLLLQLGSGWADPAARQGSPPPPRTAWLDPDQAAYVLYTSGSSGAPKGVVVSHRAVVNRLRWQEQVDLEPAARVLQRTRLGFDVSVVEVFSPLRAGGVVVLADAAHRQDAAHLAGLIAEQRITNLTVPPALLPALLAEEAFLACGALRRVVTGGERVPADLARRFYAAGLDPAPLFISRYGPTEATVSVSEWTYRPGDGGAPGAQPLLGHPIAGARLYVVDRAGRLAPPGVPGELCIAGTCLARGYLARPDLTAAAFVPDSFAGAARAGERLYRTGDLARWRGDGALEFLGRLDRQVKIRGFRIELGEIEAALAGHPAVGEAVVVDRDDPKRLVGYVVPIRGAALDPAELRSWLAQRLPPYMVPAHLVTLAALPLSANGKCDRAALPAPAAPRRTGKQRAAAPRTPVEAALAAIWRQVLGVERVGMDDNYFELGGDSILSLQVVSLARQASLRLTVSDLFRHQTIAELAAVAVPAPPIAPAASEAAPANRGAAPGDAGDAGGDIPLAPIQHWFFERRHENPHHNNPALLLAMRARLRPAILERALALLMHRHPALRFRYLPPAAGAAAAWVQVDSRRSEKLVHVDLTALPRQRREAALDEVACRLHSSLHLSRGPLLRMALVELSRQDVAGQRLLWILHHLIVDVVSWRILLADLDAACRALAGGARAALAPPAATYRRWTERLAEHARSGALLAELDLWLASGRESVLPLPLDRRPPGPSLPPAMAPANSVVSEGRVLVELDAERTAALVHEAAAVPGARITDALLTALLEAAAAWTGQPALLVNLESHGREELFDGVDVSGTVGWFTALYPALLQLPAAPSLPADSLRSVRGQLRAVPHGGIGYGILRYLGPEDIAARLRAMPAAEVVFNYLGQLDRGLPPSALFAPAAESAGPSRPPSQRRAHLLSIGCNMAEGRLHLSFTYSESYHRRSTIESLAARYLAALHELIDDARTGPCSRSTRLSQPAGAVSAPGRPAHWQSG
ncbi:MAG: amino acid adenylation domain-containing protein, partial [Acidobacteria bacterium]|nr:amino acid adenylation domain-containing protein [Acidobacteriota bacterium]